MMDIEVRVRVLIADVSTIRFAQFGLGILYNEVPPRLYRVLMKIDVDALTELINEFNSVELIRASCNESEQP